MPFGDSATARNDLRSVPSTRATSRYFSFEFDSSGVHYGVDADTLHTVGIRRRIHVVPPKDRCMVCRQYGVAVTGVYAVILFIGNIRTIQKCFLLLLDAAHGLFKGIHWRTDCFNRCIELVITWMVVVSQSNTE